MATAQFEGAWGCGVTHVCVYDPRRRAAHYVVKEIGARCEHYDLSRRLPPLVAEA